MRNTIFSFLHGKRTALVGCVAAYVMSSGCGPKATVDLPQEKAVRANDAAIKKIEADPVAFLQRSLTETQKLKAYTSTFIRQERLGIFKELKPAEHIRAEYREEPFSVKFNWMDEESEYAQCVYIKGVNDNRVALLPRKGLLGGPPSIANYDPGMAVAFQKARNPITDFGLRRMMERTLDRIEKAKPHGPVHFQVLGVKEIGDDKQTCFHLEIVYPKGDEFDCKLQDIYINTTTLVPAATYLWLTNKGERTPKTLDGSYVYGSIDPSASLTDEHFVIDVPKRKSKAEKTPSEKSEPAAASATTDENTQEGSPE